MTHGGGQCCCILGSHIPNMPGTGMQGPSPQAPPPVIPTDAKRVKLEDVKGEAVAKAEAEANDAEEAAAAVQADFDWEDM